MFDILQLLFAKNRDDIKETLKKISRKNIVLPTLYDRQNPFSSALGIHDIKSNKHKFLS